MHTSRKALLWIVALILSASACSQPEAKTDYTVKLCIAANNWGRLEKSMRAFGARHKLEFHGEIEPLSKPEPSAHLYNQLNYALIGGLHELGGDDFDLWLVSDPSTTDHVFLNVLSKNNLTLAQQITAVDFRQTLEPLACSAPHAAKNNGVQGQWPLQSSPPKT